MNIVAIYIEDTYTNEYNRLDLFDDEKISVTSSIQNIDDFSKTMTDFSQTFNVPATKQNNKIFRHWYDNSNEEPFSVLVRANAYIEIDTILFRRGKIQLVSCDLEESYPKNYSINFVGLLGNLKDKFAGLSLKDLTDKTYDFTYTPDLVVQKVTSLTPTSPATPDIVFPLISSDRYWVYGGSGLNDINDIDTPIRYNELFPAIRVRSVMNMIETQFGINFDGTTEEPSTFLSDARFTNAFLYLKNADTFNLAYEPTKTIFSTGGTYTSNDPYRYDVTIQKLVERSIAKSLWFSPYTYNFNNASATFSITPTVSNIKYRVYYYENGIPYGGNVEYTSVAGVSQVCATISKNNASVSNANIDYIEFYVASNNVMTYAPSISTQSTYYSNQNGTRIFTNTITGANVTINSFKISLRNYMPDIKIEDFFSGLLKMFNLTCYSNDGVNYTIEQLENYYDAGGYIDLTKDLIEDKKTLNRVKTYKKINFEYQKSESKINVDFQSVNGVEYGDLLYNTQNDGEEYSVKLPFENLNFKNLQNKLQVGYCLKTDYQKYIPKAIILYDYNPDTITSITGNFYLSNSLVGSGTSYSNYRAFGQETIIDSETYGLNFPNQISTLTNQDVERGLYFQYYERYFANIFDYKSRLIKVNALLPASKLSSIKLNDNIVVRDAKYLINTMTSDLTTGEVQFELLTNNRALNLAEQPIAPEEILIGTQTWLNRNYDGTTYNNGDIIPQFVGTASEWSQLTTGAWCYPDDKNSNSAIYGKLYNWYVLNDSRGFAPSGYRVPTKSDFDTLQTFVGASLGGDKLKEVGNVHWNSGCNLTANNTTGFTALGAGWRNDFGVFERFKTIGIFWTITPYTNPSFAWSFAVQCNTTDVLPINADKNFGISVRFIKI